MRRMGSSAVPVSLLHRPATPSDALTLLLPRGPLPRPRSRPHRRRWTSRRPPGYRRAPSRPTERTALIRTPAPMCGCPGGHPSGGGPPFRRASFPRRTARNNRYPSIRPSRSAAPSSRLDAGASVALSESPHRPRALSERVAEDSPQGSGSQGARAGPRARARIGGVVAGHYPAIASGTQPNTQHTTTRVGAEAPLALPVAPSSRRSHPLLALLRVRPTGANTLAAEAIPWRMATRIR